MKPPPPTRNLFQLSNPQQTNLPFQPRVPFPFPQYLSTSSNPINPLQTINPLRPPPPQKTNFSSQYPPLNSQNQNPTNFSPPISNISPTCHPFSFQETQQYQRFNHTQNAQPSPQPLSLSDLPALNTKYEDFIRRREDIRKKIDQICQFENKETREKELRNLIYTKPKMEEALALQDLLKKAGSNIAFQKEILEIERDIELSNRYLQRLQGFWLLSETQLNDWKIPQDLGEIDDMLQSTWNDIYQLLIYDPAFLEEISRFGWFFQAKTVLRHSRADCEFPYKKHCQDLKKSALESQDKKRKKSLLYRRMGRELQKHKRLVGKVKKFKQDLDIEKIDIKEIESLLKELKRFGFDVNEEVQSLEGILRKTLQLKHLDLIFEEKSSLQLSDSRGSILLEMEKEKIQKGFPAESPISQIIERDPSPRESEKTRKVSAIDHSFSKIIQEEKSCSIETSCQRDQSCFIVESFNVNFEVTREEEKMRKISALEKIDLTKKSFPASCKNNERFKDYQEVKLRKKAIVKNVPRKITGMEQSDSVVFLNIEPPPKAQDEDKMRKNLIILENPFSKITLTEKSKKISSIKPSCKNGQEENFREKLIIIESPPIKRKPKKFSLISKQSPPINSFKKPREQEQNMRNLISKARVFLSQKKKLPYKLAEKICSEFAKRPLMMPEAEEIFNLYFQEINKIQSYCDDLTNQIPFLAFEELCIWSEKTRKMESSLEGGYEEIKAELWLAKSRFIKIFWENPDKISKTICLREIRNLIVESESYEDLFTGVKKVIFQDLVSFLKNLVKKIFRKVKKEASRTEILMKNGIIYGFIDIRKELLGEVQEEKNSKKMTPNYPKEQSKPCFKNLNKKRSAEEVKGSDIILFDPKAKKLKTEMKKKEEIFICQKKSQERNVQEKLSNGKGLLNKGEVFEGCICISSDSDSDETMAGSEIEEISEVKSDLNNCLGNLEQLHSKLWNDMSYSSFKIKRKKHYDFDKSQEI